MFGSTPEKALESMNQLLACFKALPKEEQDHQMKYHLGSIFLDCPICGMKGRKIGA